eukprot:365734-Chlamydomonas_euryale.AAC.10
MFTICNMHGESRVSYRKQTQEGYACVQRSKTEGVEHRAGRCPKGKATARSPEPPHTTPPRPPRQENWAQSCNMHNDTGILRHVQDLSQLQLESIIEILVLGHASSWKRDVKKSAVRGADFQQAAFLHTSPCICGIRH